jgi:hypothetical protein
MAANSNTRLPGKNGAIYLGGAKGTGVKVAAKMEWSLQRNRDYVDATVFGDTNKTYLAGLPNVQGAFSGFLDTSGDLLLNAATSEATLIYLYADDTGGSPVPIAYGPGLIDGNVTASLSDAIRFTGEFRASNLNGSSAWTIFDGA